ncbi:MAG TPA: segregation/condensation protein A [Candidatus Ozemobacteraceae bacterium]|nr:segregation/condensation protein A [Candidatus Ozemobacteraceae bacterium]
MSAYQVRLPAFEGPFDLLYHLIEEQKVNIYDIPIATITAQYLDYLHMMEILDMEVASGFLVMAATLLEIKSRMLLPRDKPQEGAIETGDEDLDEFAYGEDPRQQLVDKMVEYRRFKLMALDLREMERHNSRIYTRAADYEPQPEQVLQISASAFDLRALYEGLVRRRLNPPIHRVVVDRIGLEARIDEIRCVLNSLRGHDEVPFRDLVRGRRDRYDVVLSFMAVLEMFKLGECELVQEDNFSPITIRPANAGDSVEEAAVG